MYQYLSIYAPGHLRVVWLIKLRMRHSKSSLSVYLSQPHIGRVRYCQGCADWMAEEAFRRLN